MAFLETVEKDVLVLDDPWEIALFRELCSRVRLGRGDRARQAALNILDTVNQEGLPHVKVRFSPETAGEDATIEATEY